MVLHQLSAIKFFVSSVCPFKFQYGFTSIKEILVSETAKILTFKFQYGFTSMTELKKL